MHARMQPLARGWTANKLRVDPSMAPDCGVMHLVLLR